MSLIKILASGLDQMLATYNSQRAQLISGAESQIQIEMAVIKRELGLDSLKATLYDDQDGSGASLEVMASKDSDWTDWEDCQVPGAKERLKDLHDALNALAVHLEWNGYVISV